MDVNIFLMVAVKIKTLHIDKYIYHYILSMVGAAHQMVPIKS